MKNEMRLKGTTFPIGQPLPRPAWRSALIVSLLLAAVSSTTLLASENVPQRPFAMLANVPEQGQFIAGVVYQESEAYHIWVGNKYQDVTVNSAGQQYGIDSHQGYFALQYGLTEQWALDANIGYSSVGWRYFNSTNGTVQSTSGLMDISIGVRYQIFNETNAPACWIPTLTFRAGVVVPGSYNEDFAFAPGAHSVAIEPELLMRKHFGWPGLGGFADVLYRWNRTTHNDQFIGGVGLFQEIKGWEVDVGYRRLQTTSGNDIVLNTVTHDIMYPRDLRENNNAIDAGFSYTTSERHIRWGFQTRSIVGGVNSDGKFWIGASVDVPFGGKSDKKESTDK